MTYIKIHDILYEATINGMLQDINWNSRESKAITLYGDYFTINNLFSDNTKWSIIYKEIVYPLDENGNRKFNENGEVITEIQTNEYDNSEFCIRGDITIHQDGAITVKMGKKTAEEKLIEMQELTDMLLLETLGV